jgi:hypothetical protein
VDGNDGGIEDGAKTLKLGHCALATAVDKGLKKMQLNGLV